MLCIHVFKRKVFRKIFAPIRQRKRLIQVSSVRFYYFWSPMSIPHTTNGAQSMSLSTQKWPRNWKNMGSTEEQLLGHFSHF